MLAFVVSHFAPVTDFYEMAGLHDVGNVVLRVNLEHDECDFRPLSFYFIFSFKQSPLLLKRGGRFFFFFSLH